LRKVGISPIQKKIVFSLLFWSLGLISGPRIADRDPQGRVERLSQALETQEKYRYFLAEDFEGERPWTIYRSDSFLNQVEFTAEVPKEQAFVADIQLSEKATGLRNQGLSSLMVHTYCENPKKDHWFLKPKEKITIPIGLPIQAILWVYSEGHHLNLSLHLTQKKSGDLRWDMGELNFLGWRRIEIPIHLETKNSRLMQTYSYPIQFLGFRIDSLPNHKKGPFHLYFDQLIFILDTTTFQYYGAEIQDTWGNSF